jgi:hypothetical protein
MRGSFDSVEQTFHKKMVTHVNEPVKLSRWTSEYWKELDLFGILETFHQFVKDTAKNC